MKKLTNLAILIFVACLLSSCASGVKFINSPPSMAAANPDHGRIFFYRPSALGAAIVPSVMLNGEKVGKATSWGFFYVDRPSGSYEVLTTTEVKRKVSFILDKGQTRFIKFSVAPGFFVGHVYGKLMDKAKALDEISNCKYIGDEKTPSPTEH